MRTLNLFLLGVWALVCQLCSAQTNSVTESALVDDSCSFEEIIERKRQAVRVRYLDKRSSTLMILTIHFLVLALICNCPLRFLEAIIVEVEPKRFHKINFNDL